MSIKAVLEIEGATHNIWELEWSVVKHADHNGMPYSEGKLAHIFLSVEAIGNDFFEEWSLTNNMTKNFDIVMAPQIQGSQPTRVLRCFDGHLISLNTHFNSESTSPMRYILEISCGGFEPSFSSTIYSTWWRKSYPMNTEGMVEQEEETNLLFEKAYFEDAEGNKIEDLENGKATLFIHSKNNEGKVVDIDLANKEHDFKYKGKVLENDILEDITLTGDVTKVALEVIDQQEA